MNVVAKHRIITDQCRARGTDVIVAEVLADVEKAIRQALGGWPMGEGTQIHTKVEIVRAS